jgi:hypothetical protein
MLLVALLCHVAWLLPHYVIGVVLLLRCLVIILLFHCWFCLVVYYIVDVASSHCLCCPIALLVLFCKT